MHEEHIEIPAALAAFVLMFPALVALAVIVFGVCVSIGLPAIVPGAIVVTLLASVSREMKKDSTRRIHRRHT